MSADEREALLRRLTDSLGAAMAAAQAALEAAEAAEIVELAELALRGVHVVRWQPPGVRGLICPHCGRVGQMDQWVATGSVCCRCELPA